MSDFLKNLGSIPIASDHAGFELKSAIIKAFPQIQWMDLGPQNGKNSVDYPDFADTLSSQIKKGAQFGVLICGSGQGMAIRANRNSFVRAALCEDEEVAQLAREHNNANVICLGARRISVDKAISILNKFFHTNFSGGRHELRVKKLSNSVTESC